MSRTRTVTVTITMRVSNPAAFRRAAREQASREGDDQFDDGLLTDCAVMLFDPGESPPGCSIEASSAEIEP
jgi:hypothetical protein